MSRVALRAWAEADLPVLTRLRSDASLQAQLMAHPQPNDVHAWLSRRSGDAAGVFFVIADAATDACLGFAQLTGIAGGEAWAGICIAPEHQGQGLGAAALGLLEQRALERSVTRIKLQVLSTNARAIALYARLGYRHVGRAVDSCLMEKAA